MTLMMRKIGQKIFKYGAVFGNRQVLFENRVQQRLSMSRNKRLTKPKWR